MDYLELIKKIKDVRSEALTFTDEIREVRYRISTLEDVIVELLLHFDELHLPMDIHTRSQK